MATSHICIPALARRIDSTQIAMEQALAPQPPPPNPAADAGLVPQCKPSSVAESPPWDDAELDIDTLPAVAAMKILCQSLETLVRLTGDVPPTPPVSRPSTPSRHHSRQRSFSSRPPTPVPSEDLKELVKRDSLVPIGAPEACESEPVIVEESAASIRYQTQVLARKFYSRSVPTVSMEDYLKRLEHWCPMSTAVYLAAGSYIHKIAVEEKLVHVTGRTSHRLVLAALRVAMKAVEDIRYPHNRFAIVGGVNDAQLVSLELAFLYVTNFELRITREGLREKTLAMRHLARMGEGMAKTPPPPPPKLALPGSRKAGM